MNPLLRLVFMIAACVAAASLRLHAAVAPTIVTHPTDQTVVAGDSATFRAVATGDASLEYYWFRDTVLVSRDPTSATFTLANAQPHDAGVYTVIARNAAGAITSRGGRLTVTNRPTPGYYFGTISNSPGTFALQLREDGTGVFLAYQRMDPDGVFLARDVRIGADRRLRFNAKRISGPLMGTEVEANVFIEPDGSIFGAFGGRALTSPPVTIAGPMSALVGFYAGSADAERPVPGPNERASNLSYLLVGPNSRAFVVFAGRTLAEGGPVTIEASGNFTGRTDNNLTAQGTVQAAARTFTSSISQATFPTLGFTGADTGRAVVEALVNLSTRALITAASPSFTAGFVVRGTQPKKVLVRGIGPALSAFGVANALSAPRLEVFRGSVSIGAGTDWAATGNAPTIAAVTASVGGFPLVVGSRDAALLLTLEPGNYSAVLSGQGGAAGTALIEVYDATPGGVPRGEHIVNISTLATAGTGDDVLAAGFNIRGTVAKRVLVRATGASGLSAFGVTNGIAQARLVIYAGSAIVAENTGWGNSTESILSVDAAKEVGAFAFSPGSGDCALVLNLAPGPYTAEVSNLGTRAGVALVEIYALP